MIVSNLQGFFSKDKKSFKKPPPKPSSLKWCQPGDILWGVYGQLDWPHWTGDGTVSGDGQGYTPIPTSKPVWEIPKKKNAPKLRGYLWMNNLSHYWQGFYTSQVVIFTGAARLLDPWDKLSYSLPWWTLIGQNTSQQKSVAESFISTCVPKLWWLNSTSKMHIM